MPRKPFIVFVSLYSMKSVHNVVLLIPVLTILLSACSKENDGEEISACRPAPDIYEWVKTESGLRLELKLESNSGLWSVAPSFAVWAEYADETKESIYVTCKAGKATWHGSDDQAESLPVWFAVRDSQGLYPDSQELDAISTATPTRPTFVIHWEPDSQSIGDTLYLHLEANLPYDYNELYTQSQGTNGQPSLIWRSMVFHHADSLEILRDPVIIGHSHPKGEDSEIYKDRIGITTAQRIFNSIQVSNLNR